jgi:hypothetical protein
MVKMNVKRNITYITYIEPTKSEDLNHRCTKFDINDISKTKKVPVIKKNHHGQLGISSAENVKWFIWGR